MTNFKKGDIVRIDYTVRIKDSDKVVDTTSAEIAKEAGIFNEKHTYAPLPYIIQSERFYKIIDDAFLEAEVGKEVTMEIPCEKADGPKDPSLISMVPIKEIYKLNVMPVPGLEVMVNDREGVITTVGSGRVKVDFNKKLAGKDLIFTYTIVESIESDEEKASAIVWSYYKSKDFKFEFGDKISIYVPDVVKFDQKWFIAKFNIVETLRTVFGPKDIQFIEVWENLERKSESDEATSSDQ